MEGAAKEEVNGRKIEVYGSVFCPYSNQATRFLREKGIGFSYREVPMLFGYKPPFRAFREMKRRSGGKTTVPQIFIDGDYYGDEERLFIDDRDGKIDTLMR